MTTITITTGYAQLNINGELQPDKVPITLTTDSGFRPHLRLHKTVVLPCRKSGIAQMHLFYTDGTYIGAVHLGQVASNYVAQLMT